MKLNLREGLSYGLCSGRIVLLDARADRYLLLPEACRSAFLSLACGHPLASDAHHLAMLTRMGLLRMGARSSLFPPAATIEPATRDLSRVCEGRPLMRDLAGAVIAEAGAILDLRSRPLGTILDRMEAGLARVRPNHVQDRGIFEPIAGAFARTSLVFPAGGRCLVRALALMRLCRRRGLSPRLVLGVRLDPFAAHCWVQQGDAILIGGLEESRHFAPVRVIG